MNQTFTGYIPHFTFILNIFDGGNTKCRFRIFCSIYSLENSIDMANVLSHSLFTDHDIYLFKEGNHYQLYEKFGAHSMVFYEA